MSENGHRTLDEAKAWLRARVKDGATCPCCEQRAQIYNRKLNRTHIGVLGALTAEGGRDKYVHAAEACRRRRVRQQGDAGKLALFRLVVNEKERREDGGRSGYWRVTDRGVRFLRGEISLPKYARVYDDELLGYTGDWITVTDVDEGFRFDDLMKGQ